MGSVQACVQSLGLAHRYYPKQCRFDTRVSFTLLGLKLTRPSV
jgi:hypothetical protein